jgi:hypothetical protein
MVTACDAGAGVFGKAWGGKDVLPDPLAVGVGDRQRRSHRPGHFGEAFQRAGGASEGAR